MNIPAIPIITPVSVGKAKSSGRTRPLEMQCQSEAGIQAYIVKLWNTNELGLGVHSLAREIYGSLLANYFDLLTPKIALVNIETDFFMSQTDPEIHERLRISPGLSFGSLYIHKAPIFNQPLPSNKISEATKIYCFDMLIGNVDRNDSKPNMLQNSEGFILIDHE